MTTTAPIDWLTEAQDKRDGYEALRQESNTHAARIVATLEAAANVELDAAQAAQDTARAYASAAESLRRTAPEQSRECFKIAGLAFKHEAAHRRIARVAFDYCHYFRR